jgi:hypothetical protein
MDSAPMKRLVVTFLLPLLLVSLLTTGIQKGDVSGDGQIDLSDAILAVKGLWASAATEHTGRLLASSLGAAVSALKGIAGLDPQFRDDTKGAKIVKVELSLLALPSPSKTVAYQHSTSLVVSECLQPDSPSLTPPTPPPELA